MTTTDSNGIVFLEETDPISPFHTLINVLQQGTSNAISALSPDWTNLPLAAQFSAPGGFPTVKYRVVDGWCELSGLVFVDSEILTTGFSTFVSAGAPAAIGTSLTRLHITGGANSAGVLTGPVYLNPRATGFIGVRAAVGGTRYFTVDGIRYRVA